MFYNANAPFCFVDINTTMENNPMGTGYKQIVLQADCCTITTCIVKGKNVADQNGL